MEHTNSSTSTSDAAHGLMDRVRSGATAQLSTTKDRATDGLGSLAQAVRQSTQPFRENQQDTIAQYIEKAADQLDRFSSHLRQRDINDIVDDVQRFARRQPAVFIGAAFAAGVVAARFLKSSNNGGSYRAVPRYGQQDTRYGQPATGYGQQGADYGQQGRGYQEQDARYGDPVNPASRVTPTTPYSGGGL